MQLCTITGTIYDKFGVAAPNVRMTVIAVKKNGSLIATPQEFAKSNGSGVISLQLPRASEAWVYASIHGLDGHPERGTKIQIPDTATANFEDLLPPLQGAPPASYVYSFNGRAGNITLTSADVIAALGYTPGNAGNSLVGATYTHTQNSAATVWTITHNLNSYPSVTVVDSAGTKVEGTVEYVSANQIRLIFSAAFSGKAFLN